jgi:hypothetical protein
MLQTLPPEMRHKLAEIGFDDNEIAVVGYIHQFKGRDILDRIREFVRDYCFQRMMEGATTTWQQKQWDEEQAFEIVERYRSTKRQ